MPGPAGQEEYVFRGDKGPTIDKPQSYPFGSKMVTGAAAGAASGGWVGSAVGAGIGLIGDTISYFANKRATEKANARAEKAAASAFYREQASQREAAEWNSEAAQVSRMKAAGLSPALLYNQMGPSTMGAASGSAANIQQQAPADFDTSGAYNSYLKSKEIDNLASLQRSQSALNEVEVLKTQIDNMTLHQRNIADMELQLSQMDKNSAEAQKLRQLLDLERDQLSESINNIAASTRKIGAETEFISGAQTANVRSQTAENLANIELIGEKVATEKTVQGLNQEQQKKLVAEINQIDFVLDNNYDFRDAVKDKLEEHGIDPRYWKYVTDFLSDVGPRVTAQTSETLLSWFKADNWFNLFSRWLASKNIGRANSYEHIIQDEEKKN